MPEMPIVDPQAPMGQPQPAKTRDRAIYPAATILAVGTALQCGFNAERVSEPGPSAAFHAAIRLPVESMP